MFDTELEITDHKISQEKEIKADWKGRNKILQFADAMLVCVENSKESTKEFQELINNILITNI